jgi:hypothetical protein
MAALGYAHLALEHPEQRDELLPRMELALTGALATPTRGFDRAAWGTDPIDDVGTDRAHAAYLGYLNLALSLHRYLDPDSRFSEENDAITSHLARLLAESDTGLVETYPDEVYPVDNTAFIGSLGPYDAATGADHGELVAAFTARLAAQYVDRDTGLLIQAVDPATGAMRDEARGSGTALAAYFLSFSDRRASRALWDAMRAHLLRDGVGLAAMREYPVGVAGSGDIDSGPVFLGLGVSATGFALGVSRAHGDSVTYRHLWATTSLVGAPTHVGSGRRFVMGGAIGDTLLFAMLTTPRRLPWDA